MCLLIIHSGDNSNPDNIPHDDWLKDFYARNRDGFGFMYMHEGKLITEHSLGKVQDFIDTWRRIESYNTEFACHLRMRTHGNVDMENVHPYKVLGPETGKELWMMHNGVLSCGNTADTTKSDTWHFANHILKPMVDPTEGRSPDVVFTPQFQYLLSEAVGSSNRLALMDDRGRLAITRKSGWIEWGNMLFSNTYAWSASDAGVTSTYYETKKGRKKKAREKKETTFISYGRGYLGEGYIDFFPALKTARLNRAHMEINYSDVTDFKQSFSTDDIKKLIALAEGGYITEAEFIEAIKKDFALAREFLKLSLNGEREVGVAPDSKSIVVAPAPAGTSASPEASTSGYVTPSPEAQNEAAAQADLELEYSEVSVPILPDKEIYTLFGLKRRIGELYKEEINLKAEVNSSVSTAKRKEEGIARIAEIQEERKPLFEILIRLKAIDKTWKEEDKQLAELEARLDRYNNADVGTNPTVIQYNKKRIEDTASRITILLEAIARRDKEPTIIAPVTEGT